MVTLVDKFQNNELIPYQPLKVINQFKTKTLSNSFCSHIPYYRSWFIEISHIPYYRSWFIEINGNADNTFYYFLSAYYVPSILPDTLHILSQCKMQKLLICVLSTPLTLVHSTYLPTILKVIMRKWYYNLYWIISTATGLGDVQSSVIEVNLNVFILLVICPQIHTVPILQVCCACF